MALHKHRKQESCPVTRKPRDAAAVVFRLKFADSMHFGITEKPTMDCISPYNNVGLISKVSEKIASENAENCRSRQPNYCLTPPPQEPLRTFAQILYHQKLQSLAYISAADSMGLSSFQFLW